MTDSRHMVSCIGLLCFSFALVLLIKGGLDYQRDSKIVTTECKIIEHRVKPSFCLYKWHSFSGIMRICHRVHQSTAPDGQNITRCRDHLMSPCYASHDEAWDDLAKNPIGTIYPCYYEPDDSKYAFDDRYQWEASLRIGAFLFAVSIVSLFLVVTSKSYAKLE